MARIDSQTGLARHPKTLRLARRLAISVPAAVGHLHLLWGWALEYAQGGNVGHFDAAELALACLWEGDESALLPALQHAGFVDVDGCIHDWREYTGRLIEQRKLTSEWHRARRRMLPIVLDRDGYICQICGEPVLPEELSLDHVYPKSRGGAHTKENLRVVHKRCNSKKGARV
jgi:hypothetical protein